MDGELKQLREQNEALRGALNDVIAAVEDAWPDSSPPLIAATDETFKRARALLTTTKPAKA